MFGLSSCGSSGIGLCERAVSVPSFTLKFSTGLDNFSEDQYEQLRLESLDVRDVVNLVAQEEQTASSRKLLSMVDSFVLALDNAGWDVSVAMSSKDAVDSAAALGTPETLKLANEVDVFVISQCGLPSTLAPLLPSAETLPSPSIPAPLQTDPPMTPPNQESEDRELGRTVATLFGLTLSEADMLCLGEQLQGIYDVTDDDANLQQYQGQFQRAFDSCSIEFAVPVN